MGLLLEEQEEHEEEQEEKEEHEHEQVGWAGVRTNSIICRGSLEVAPAC